MSYVRWSCDDHRSDVYVYEHYQGGYVTHVAGRRYVGECPRMPQLADIPVMEGAERTAAISAWVEANKVQRAWLTQAALEDIGLPHDGESFVDATRSGLLVRLLNLRAVGYRVPAFVFDRIRWEIEYRREAAQVARAEARKAA